MVKGPYTVDLAWHEAARAPILAYLDPFVRALAAGGEAPEAIASGVLATCRAQPVLLTAKHVLDGLEDRPLLLDLPGRFEPLDLSHGQVATSEDADAAVLRLPPCAMDWAVPFVRLEAQSAAAAPPGGFEVHVAMGFPWRESSVDRAGGKLNLTSVNYWGAENEEAYRLLRLPRERFVASTFDTQNAYRDGVRRQMKQPHGMSGGALWRLAGDRPELAGILTRYEKARTKCVVSARVSILQALASELVCGDPPS